MVATIPMVKWAQWRKGFLHQWLGNKAQRIHITPAMRGSLLWWLQRKKPLQLSLHPSHHLGHNNDRCQKQRLGRSLSSGGGLGLLGFSFSRNSVEHPRVTGSVPGSVGVSPSDNRGICIKPHSMHFNLSVNLIIHWHCHSFICLLAMWFHPGVT